MTTLAEAQEHLAAWKKASLSAAKGEEIEISSGEGRKQRVKMDPDKVLKQVQYWEGEVQRLTAEAANPGTDFSGPALVNFNV